MKTRIVKIACSLALALPASYFTTHFVRIASVNDVEEAVLFYGNLPARYRDTVTNFKMLPERMNPTCSECNQP